MSLTDLAQLELLAEIDAFRSRLDRWTEEAPDWQPAATCRALVKRLEERIDGLKLRWESPLVVATLGGSGSGKSALINALLGEEVVQTGKQRPTTILPTLLCRPDISPKMLGIDPASVVVVTRNLPMLRDLVLIDCPDPDTTEDDRPIEGNAIHSNRLESAASEQGSAEVSCRAHEGEDQVAADSNLARLRKILPHCDVLLVATTQQKYRSARVTKELAAASTGSKLVFVQTHADTDDDIRADWHRILSEHHEVGPIFWIDSLAALHDARNGLQPRGDFAGLVDLLRRQMAGAAAHRIRRVNFLDLLAETLQRCRQRLDERMPDVEQLENAFSELRGNLATKLAKQMQVELLASRRPWENRLLAQTAARWGLSPFSFVLRAYQSFGTLALGTLLFRARTPAQMALWGTMEGVRFWQKKRQEHDADRSWDRLASACWDRTEVRKAALVLEGYAADAGLNVASVSAEQVADETRRAGENFLGRASTELESLVSRLAERHTGWFSRGLYETLFLAMLGWLVFRLGKNFFYDSWLASNPTPVFGLEFYLAAGFWLVLWSLLLLGMFTGRLRRGLRRELDHLAESWRQPGLASELFSRLESDGARIRRFRNELDRLEQDVKNLKNQVAES